MIDSRKLRIYPYKQGSKSAKSLADALGVKVLKLEGSKWRHRDDKTIINWGATHLSDTLCRVLNQPLAVRGSSDKLVFFKLMKEAGELGPRLPLWTESIEEATDYFNDPRNEVTVVCRQSLTNHSGRGIVLASSPDELVECPLYTKYIPKDGEYRIHIVKGEVIDVQRKIRDPDKEPTNWKVRSHENGFMFVRGGFKCPADVLEQARKAFFCSGLDFAAIDVIFNKKKEQAFILEANCAPGLEGQTVEKYAEVFRKILDA